MTFESNANTEPRESCSFSLNTDDFKHIRKHFRKPLTYLQALSPVLLLWIFGANPGFVLRIGWIIAIAINIAAYVVYRTRWNKLFTRLTGTFYRLDVYSNYFILTTDKILNEKQTTKVNFVSITQIANVGSCLLIMTNGGNYYVKKDVLDQNSAIYAVAHSMDRKYTSKPMPRSTKTAALVFAILSIAAFIGAVGIYGYILAAENKIYAVFIWMMFVFPIISAIFLLILKFKGYYVIKHFVISCVSVALILGVCVFTGLTRVASYIPYTTSISYAEEYFDIDIPEYESAITYADNPFDRHHYLTIVRFDNTEFRNAVKANSNWLQNPTESLEDIAIFVSYQRYYYKDAEYVMLYNTDTGELNTLPSESGRYHFIAVYFEMYSRNDKLYIVEYDVDYVK